MAKSKFYFGLRQGSTKSATYQVHRGKQVTKDRVTKVSNPQTDLQGSQRMRLAMVANAASRLDGLVNHSFQSVEYGYKSVGEFRRINMIKSSRCKITSWSPKGMMDPGLATYQISRGSLNPFDYKFIDGRENELAVSNLGNFKVDASSFTVDAAIEAILATGEFEEGDQLTFLAQWMHGSTENLVQPYTGSFYPTACFAISRLVLKTGLAEDGKANNAWSAQQVSSKHSDNYGQYVLSDGYFQIDPAGDLSSSIGAAFKNAAWVACLAPADVVAAGGYQIGSAAVILSRQNGSVWQRSTQNLVVNTNIADVLTAAQAWPTYIKSSSASSKYLNSGSTSVGIVGDN